MILYVLCNTRGYKKIVTFFPNSLHFIVPLFNTLSQPTPHQTTYISLLWLSHLSFLPFDFNLLSPTLKQEIIAFAKSKLSSNTKECDASGILLARILGRRDSTADLIDFISFAITEIKNGTTKSDDLFVANPVKGILITLYNMFKFSNRVVLEPVLKSVLEVIELLDENVAGEVVVLKLKIKLMQRVAEILLKPKKWKYVRGVASLRQNLKSAAQSLNDSGYLTVADSEDDAEIPSEIEQFIDFFLTSLRNKNTVIRVSSAKGLARICDRLPKLFAKEVLGSVLEFFLEDVINVDGGADDGMDISMVDDSVWHGALLTLAEFALHGVLLPEWLPEVVPWINKALLFPARTHTSTQIQDAASYIVWSIGHTYPPSTLIALLQHCAKTLVKVMCFEREGNVRRAASAAFQEVVGRVGGDAENGVKGIEVIQLTDYFEVGSKENSFSAGIKIARFPEYRESILQHLLFYSSVHWDVNIRNLSGKSLQKVVADGGVNDILAQVDRLIKKCTDDEIQVRHGSLITLSDLILGYISHIDSTKRNEETATITQILQKVGNLLSSYPTKYLEAFKSELTRIGICTLIKSYFEVLFWSLQYSENSAGEFWSPVCVCCWDLLDKSLERKEENVQICAAGGLESLLKYLFRVWWMGKDGKDGMWKEMEGRVKKYVVYTAEASRDKYVKRGYALGMGSFAGGVAGVKVLGGAEKWKEVQSIIEGVVDGLCKCSEILAEKPYNDAEFRRNAITSLYHILESYKKDLKVLFPRSKFQQIVLTMLRGLQDYETDSRGDVGSWIREVCVKYLEKVVEDVYSIDSQSNEEKWLDSKLVNDVVRGLVQQSVEKIDRIRECAGNVLMNFVWFGEGSGNTLGIERVEELRRILPKSLEINWLNPSEVYPKFMPTLELDEYREDLLTGLVVSVGGISESLVRHSSSSLLEFLNELPPSSTKPTEFSLTQFFNSIISIARKNQKYDRVVVPVFQVIDLLIGNGVVERCVVGNEGEEDGDIASGNEKLIEEIVDVVMSELNGSRDVKKILSGVNLISGIAVICDGIDKLEILKTRGVVVYHMISYLAHPYPKVRRATSEQVYVVLTTTSDIQYVMETLSVNGGMVDWDGVMSQVEELVLGTNWDLPLKDVKLAQAKIAELFCIPVPKTKWK
ncbi:hypothetical protein HK098_007538 [Nowakowskiella sp. JEL0407]|nr:hypothetical protein HK098_007538 [Nowakowskiella sp. JEL0407]